LSFKENLLQQRSLYPSYSKSDFESADLTSIENFLMRYINQIEDSELQKKQYSHIKKQLKKTTFDITSLDITILDSFCSSLINEANALNYKLHDEKNHSIKEKQRIQVELNTQKKFISDHLEEMIGMKDIHISLLSEKIISLQKIKRDRINQNLSSLYNQLTQKKENLRRNLELDIDLIKEKINFFNEKMNVLPVKWKKEKCLEFQQEMNMKIMQSLASMVEAKTIQNNMEKMLSKPFEFSLVPIFPKKPKLLFFMIIYSFIGTFCFFTIKFCFYLIKGQSASEETLAAMNFRVNGSISAACDGNNRDLLADKDLESLRKIISFIEQKKIINPVIGIISNNGPDYSNILASLFSQKGKKVLLINASFQDIHTAKDKVGLLQYLKKEIDVLPIERKDDFDFVPCGGRYRYSVELLGSTIFTSLIDEMRNKYDIIFLFSQSSFKFAQTRIFNQVCDKLIVSFKDESLLEIKNIFNDPSERLSFVAIE
jgi:hypothetical protein